MYEQRRRGLEPMVWVVLVISWIIILLVAWYLFGRDGTDTNTTWNDATATQWYIDQEVTLQWVITVSDDISAYSHILIDEKWASFGLISTEEPLTTSNSPVTVQWVIASFKKWVPVVSVTSIQEWSAAGNAQLGNVLYLEDEQILVNFSDFPGATFSKNNEGYAFTDEAWTEQFTFARLTCSASECTDIRSSLVWSKRFTNDSEMTFSQIPDTNNWVLFLDNTSYIQIALAAWVSFETYSNLFMPIPRTYFVKSYDTYKTLCKDIYTRLSTVESDAITIAADGTATISLEWTTADGNSASCVVSTTLLNPNEATLISYEWVEWVKEELPTPSDTQVTDPTPTTTTTWTVLSWSTKPVPAEYATRKPYPSIRWWTMFVEKNIISFNGAYSTWYAGCPYKVNLSLRTNGTGAWADSEFYECTSTAWASALKNAGYTSIWKTDLSEFFRKDITDWLQSVGIYIQ